jgi:DNA segregation ATPase FtsK/SpoIIIE, S-DNA-T family
MSTQTNRGASSQATQEPFNRPPRIMLTFPLKDMTAPAPPTKEDVPDFPNMWMLTIPIAMVLTMCFVYFDINHWTMVQAASLLPIALVSVMSPIATIMASLQKRGQVSKKNRTNTKRYTKFIAEMREQLDQQTDEQRRIATIIDPPPALLEARIRERSRLWERRPEDTDFLSIRVGLGPRPLALTLTVSVDDPLNSLTVLATRLRDDFSSVPNMPCTVSLTKVKALGISGIRQEVVALTRSMLCQLATAHSPEEVRILGIYPASQQQDWEWLRDLPHTMPLKGYGLSRLVAVGEDEADQLLNVLLEELSQRAAKQSESVEGAQGKIGIQAPVLPHLVVLVHDYVDVHKHPALTQAFKLGEQLGTSIIYMVAQEQATPSACRGIVRLSENCQLRYGTTGEVGEALVDVIADMFDLAQAQNVAKALSRIQLKALDGDESDLPTDVSLVDLVGLTHSDQFKANQWWAQPKFGMLRVPIGIGTHGILWFDLNDQVHGPHGIIAGTTGAGKSELLQSIIIGLAMTHHPHLINFVLVDFKGGAAFKPFEHIPHTVGMVSDLSGKLTERALIALKSELRRREHVLSSTNAKNISEYISLRAQSPADIDPLPHLFIIIDEFAELAKEHPSFMEGLVSVVQKGRSLGVHLILATQKPTGSVSGSIWSNLKFRISLRLASMQDSRDMLGRSEAALIPASMPGRGYFQIGSEIFELFQSARISKNAYPQKEVQGKSNGKAITDQEVLIGDMEQYESVYASSLFRPWPDPLPRQISLDEINSRLPVSVAGADQPLYGWVTCYMGLIDLPAEQKQEPWLLDMPRRGGHLLIAGASGTGKSTLLRTLIASLAQAHKPSQLHFYLIDYGGQALRVFEKLPHVGGVFGESDEEYIRRLLRQLNGIIEERKLFYATHQIDDFLAYQRRRLEDSSLAELPAIVLIIDKFVEFRQAYDKEMDIVMSIARHGRTYGVYLVLATDRPSSVPIQLMSLFEMRIGLRLVESIDSLILLNKSDAASIEPGLPGRAYQRSKTLDEVHIALPAKGEDDDERGANLENWVNTLALADKTPKALRAQPIRLLPEYVPADYFLMDIISSSHAGSLGAQLSGQERTSSLSIRIGLEDFSLRPITLDLNSETPHALIAGGPGSGRTSALQTSLLMLASPQAHAAKVIMIDFRRSSRHLRRLPYMWMYADTEERFIKAIDELKNELRTRQIHYREALESLPSDSDELPDLPISPILLIIDDYEQVNALTKNPLPELKEFMLQARDLHLHTLVVGTPTDMGRTDVFLQQVRSCRMGIILGSDPTDPPLLGVRMTDMPPGRGHLVRRNQRNLIQVAHLSPDTISTWIVKLTTAQQGSEDSNNIIPPKQAMNSKILTV